MAGDGALYRRVPRGKSYRYEKVSQTDTDGWFPVTGIWLVEETRAGKSMRCIITQKRLADLPDPMPVAALERHRDTLVKAMDECHRRWQTTPMSLHDVADAILGAIAATMEKENRE